ncbi:TonB-dependent receptor [Inhella proteolytica]|uniref:TonB-dependent siderophore receptor n=1 Tax=Inhella proteolytica TaxID=2795029 RepID=A0A931J4B4_9BURK|nr:TonB-dependent siderophore receptor [Inhella proteolytica]MBH9578498.1 TonB-dependent siderophore receptor [Inhella proteolytica]
MNTHKLSTLIPLGALAAGFSLAAAAQTAPTPAERELPTVKAKARKEPQGKDGVQATQTELGKGKQELRDIPQSITVVTEKLMDDRNLDTLKDVLRNTAGISFLAAEGGEEDIRLRGFPLQATGDVFVDGMRDPAFYERDTFFDDRVEVLRGSASMLFGRGSTGGAVNQVRKKPRLLDQNEVELTVGSHSLVRAVGDFNLKMGESSALRIGTMLTKADNDGSGNRLDKQGIAAAWRTGIGERDEFLVSLYHLNNDNGMNYGMPWIKPTLTAPVNQTTLMPVDPKSYYGMASDRNAGEATFLTASHTHRFDRQHEITTKISKGTFERDQRAGTVRFAAASLQPDKTAVSLATFGPNTVLSRGTQLKVQDLDTLFLQSDYSGKFEALGLKHHVQAGVDFAKEEKTVYAALSAAQGGSVPTKPSTGVGTPNDGAWVDESLRKFRVANEYESRAQGLYLQDLVQLHPEWKLLLGLRYDHLVGDYDAFSIPANAPSPTSTASYRMKISEWSQRAGVLFQPNERMSFHLGAATSFNTSGDAYSLSAQNASIPPEQALNVEAGAKIDSADGRFSTRFAVFRSTKLHERNTDPLVNLVTLSGKRHVAGFEMDLAGRLTPEWEVFSSYVWMPIARIDEAAPGAEGLGTRPSLTPRHSGSLWTTYQLTSTLRVGGGLNWRSSVAPLRNPGFTAPSFVVGELMAEYQVMPNKLFFKGNISNVTNKLYADTLYPGHYVPGAGRLFQLTGTYRF